jgi:hypothetical protein
LKIKNIFTKGSRKKNNKKNKDWTGRNKTWQIKIEGLNQKQIKFV